MTKKQINPKQKETKLSRTQTKAQVLNLSNIILEEFKVSINENGWCRFNGWLINGKEMQELIGRNGEYSYRIKNVTVNLEIDKE